MTLRTFRPLDFDSIQKKVSYYTLSDLHRHGVLGGPLHDWLLSENERLSACGSSAVLAVWPDGICNTMPLLQRRTPQGLVVECFPEQLEQVYQRGFWVSTRETELLLEVLQ